MEYEIGKYYVFRRYSQSLRIGLLNKWPQEYLKNIPKKLIRIVKESGSSFSSGGIEYFLEFQGIPYFEKSFWSPGLNSSSLMLCPKDLIPKEYIQEEFDV